MRRMAKSPSRASAKTAGGSIADTAAMSMPVSGCCLLKWDLEAAADLAGGGLLRSTTARAGPTKTTGPSYLHQVPTHPRRKVPMRIHCQVPLKRYWTPGSILAANIGRVMCKPQNLHPHPWLAHTGTVQVEPPGRLKNLLRPSPDGPAAWSEHSWRFACIHTYVRTYIRTYVRTYIHTYIHTYIPD